MSDDKGIPCAAVDPRDEGTPDSWVPRHPSLIRLTGRHPFNCEAPLPDLVQDGFITSSPLHYVRNHGAVPMCDWETHTLRVHGHVNSELVLSMSELTSRFESVSFPVLLVCAGNRRREQNLVKQSKGFNWGAGGLSNAVWTGVRLRDVLVHAGVKISLPDGFVRFEGVEPLPQGKYGTSVPLFKALDQGSDIILAYRMNGQPLPPDHGYPLRLIIPGYIGGRMVKWLGSIEVALTESNSHYHYYDNRVFPSHLDADMATREDWWHRPEWAINDLNLNSAITCPAHNSTRSLLDFSPFVIKGYAYTGGGRQVIRVEVSVDDGCHWHLCNIAKNETPNRYGRYWCWFLWEVSIDFMDVIGTKEIVVRSWDSSMNTQPQHLTWNVMGMMNNCWFRVKIFPERENETGKPVLRFEHPTVAGNASEGWMVRESAQSAPASTPAPATSAADVARPKKQYTIKQVEKHNSEDDCWIVVRGKVYDATPFLEGHPGGADSILLCAGADCTEEFDALHSTKARDMLEDYYVGDLATDSELEGLTDESDKDSDSALSASGSSSSLSAVIALQGKRPLTITLTEKEWVSHDVVSLKFSLPSADSILGLPVGKHVLVCARIGNELIMRGYTPISPGDRLGEVELLVKVYSQGVMSSHLGSLAIGATVDMKGPIGQFEYRGHGEMRVGQRQRRCRHFAMIAGGTGITPVFQVLSAILRDPTDLTTCSMIYANKTEADIILRDVLDNMQKTYPSRVQIWYTLSTAPEGWTYDTGHINLDMMRAHLGLGLGLGLEEEFVLMCGPPGMLKHACEPNLEQMGYTHTHRHAF